MANHRKSSGFRMWQVALVIAVVGMLAGTCSLILRYRQAYRQATEIQIKGLQHLEVARSITIVGTARDTLLPRLIALADDYVTCDWRRVPTRPGSPKINDIFAFGWYDDGWSEGRYHTILLVYYGEMEGAMKVMDVEEMPGYSWYAYGPNSSCRRNSVPVGGGNSNR